MNDTIDPNLDVSKDGKLSAEWMERFRRDEYSILCNKDEIERVLNIRCASDYLLKLRADTILNEMRLERVYRNKKRIVGNDRWSLENSFVSVHYTEYLKLLSVHDRKKCESITAGNIFSREPNGEIFTSEFGPIITISDSLQFFLKFMHLCLLKFESHVPDHVRINALKIAIRVMLRSETMDFLMDPRGTLPSEIGHAIHEPMQGEFMFISGHEYSHYLLGHINENKTNAFSVRQETEYKIFSNSENEEFRADEASISNAINRNNARLNLLNSALLWFGCLNIYEAAQDFMNPMGQLHSRTHPSAADRYDNLISKFQSLRGFEKNKWVKFKSTVRQYRDFLIDDLSTNIEFYEMYGSAYLDAPNTEWRGKELVDRVDYY